MQILKESYIMFAKLILTALIAIFVFSESLYATDGKADTDIALQVEKHLDKKSIEALPTLTERKKKKQWFDAAKTGNLLRLEQLHKFVNMNGRHYRTGRAVSHMAVIHRQYKALKKFKELGGDYLIRQARDNQGRAPIHYAASFGDSTAIRTLFNEGADLEVRSKDGLTPLLEVLIFGGWNVSQAQEAFNTLVELGANLNAEDNNGVRASELALDKGWIKEIPDNSVDKNAEAQTESLQEHIRGTAKKKMWFEAAKAGFAPLLEELHETMMIDINAQDSRGNTAAHLAVIFRQYDVLRTLKDLGGDYLLGYARMSGGLAPLHAAAINGDLIAIRTLFDLGAYLEVKDSRGMTPLSWTLAAGRQEAFNTLVELGANTDVEYLNSEEAA